MDKKDKLSWKFYALLGSASLGLVGGLYYLYNLFSNNCEVEISQEQKSKLDELSNLYQNYQENTDANSTQKAETESTFTIRVFKQINELSEEMFKKDHPNWIEDRRRILEKSTGNNSDYNLCNYKKK